MGSLKIGARRRQFSVICSAEELYRPLTKGVFTEADDAKRAATMLIHLVRYRAGTIDDKAKERFEA